MVVAPNVAVGRVPDGRGDRQPSKTAPPLPRRSWRSRTQGQVQFRFKQLLDEAGIRAANPSFQGIEPVIAKKMSSLGGINRCLRVIRRHGVISVGLPNANSVASQAGDYATFKFQPLSLRHPLCPLRVLTSAPLAASHSMTLLSSLPETISRPLGEKELWGKLGDGMKKAA